MHGAAVFWDILLNIIRRVTTNPEHFIDRLLITEGGVET
jgi:hypothetical protein